MVVNVRHWRVFLLMSASEIHLAVKRQIHLHLLQQMLVSGFELVEPLYHMFIDYEEAVEHLHRRGEMVLGPFVHVGHVDDDPVVLEGIHCCVGQDHRFSSAAQSTQKYALAGRSGVVETSEIRHLFVDFKRRIGWQFFESLGEVTCAWQYLDLHNFLHRLICHLEDIIKPIDALQNGVDQGITND